MKLLRETIRRMLIEQTSYDGAWDFFMKRNGYSQMDRRDVPSKEQLSSRRKVQYWKYQEGDCMTMFQIEDREMYDFVNDKPVTNIWIHGIRSVPEDKCQGRGMGTTVMKAIIRLADTLGLGVAGDVRPYGNTKMTEDDMKAFDARFGLLPLEHYKKYLSPEILNSEDDMWEIDDMIADFPTWVWRPARGSMR